MADGPTIDVLYGQWAQAQTALAEAAEHERRTSRDHTIAKNRLTDARTQEQAAWAALETARGKATR